MHFVFLIFVGLFASKASANQKHLHDHTEYYVYNKAKSFKNARLSCSMDDAELVMIQTEDVQVFLEELFDRSIYSSGNY